MNQRRDDGVTLIIVAIFITVLFVMLAIAVDLSFTRADRRGGQLAVDNAAATAAQTMAESNAAAACTDALQILSVTLGETFTSTECATAFASCNNSIANAITPVVAGQYTVTIHHPVLDTSRLMLRTSTINNSGISSADDGDPCDRIGVEVTTNGPNAFGQVTGATGRTSNVYAVGKVTAGSVTTRPLNLLVLERTSCQTLNVSGQGTVVVAPSRDPATNEWVAGIAAADSDGTTNCGGNKAVVEATGQGVLRADGPCPADPFAVCTGEGRIPLIPAFTTGACTGTTDLVACKEGSNAEITPNVEASPGLFTRAPIDHRYNCKVSYASEVWAGAPLNQPIGGCTGATSNSDYVDELRTFATAGAPVGWTVIGPGNGPCRPSNRTFVGNYYVNCSSFRPDGNVTFQDGNVIFAGDIVLNTGDVLTIHGCPCANTYAWTAGQNYDENASHPDAGWVWVAGQLSQSSGRLVVNKAALFFGSGGYIDQTGGDVFWEAPDSHGPFDDLAMWSDGTTEHHLTGGGLLDLVGVFFNGQSTFRYSGSGNQTLDEAQFIANRLDFDGQGTVSMSPAPGRAIEFPIAPTFGLVR